MQRVKVFPCIYMYVCVCVYIYICVCVCIFHARSCVCIYMHVHVFVYIRTWARMICSCLYEFVHDPDGIMCAFVYRPPNAILQSHNMYACAQTGTLHARVCSGEDRLAGTHTYTDTHIHTHVCMRAHTRAHIQIHIKSQ